MKEFLKVVGSIIVIYIILTLVLYIVDSNLLKQAKEPKFSKKSNENSIDAGARYKGIGYTLESYKENHKMYVKGKLFNFYYLTNN